MCKILEQVNSLVCCGLFYRYILAQFLQSYLCLLRITLNALFWLASSSQWILKSVPVMSSSSSLYNNHVNDTQGHSLSCHHSAWFLWVIMSSSCFGLLAIKHDFYFFLLMYKTNIRFSFCDKGCQPPPLASANNPYLNLDYSGYHKKLIQ